MKKQEKSKLSKSRSVAFTITANPSPVEKAGYRYIIEDCKLLKRPQTRVVHKDDPRYKILLRNAANTLNGEMFLADKLVMDAWRVARLYLEANV